MRKLTLAAAVVVALVATSVAVAHGIGGAKTATSVAGTFTATAGKVTSQTCTSTDGKTIVVTTGDYSGSATGSTDLTGAIKLHARSVINTTDGVGTVTGAFRIDQSGRDTRAAFASVYDHGTIAGLADGRVHQPSARLLANLSATFSPTTGFTNAKLGGGTAGGSAVEVSNVAAPCKGPIPPAGRTEARGQISALSADSITVSGLTCGIPSATSADVNKRFKTGDSVEIRCTYANGQLTLAKIESGTRH
jgi:hypothetical protein